MAPARGVVDTHLLKNLKGENMMTTMELSCSRMEQELASVKRRQREADREAEDMKTQSYVNVIIHWSAEFIANMSCEQLGSLLRSRLLRRLPRRASGTSLERLLADWN